MKRFSRCLRAISPVLAILMMIAVAIAGSLVTYAWVMGYIGFQTEKAGETIQIQSIANDYSATDLIVYVQNTGEKAVQLDENSCLYVDGILVRCTITNVTVSEGIATLGQGATAVLMYSGGAVVAGEKVPVKVTTTLGTATEQSSYTKGSTCVPTLDHFEFEVISSPQTSGVPFAVTIKAVDQYGALFTAYCGSNVLICSGGKLVTAQTGDFVAGVWTGAVTVTGSVTGVRISTVAVEEVSWAGKSNAFDVVVVWVEEPTTGTWSQYHGNARHDGLADSEGPTTGTLVWSRDMLVPIENPRFPNDGRLIYSGTRTDPGLLVVDGKLIVAVPDLMYKYIYGLDPATGSIEYTGHTARTINDDPTSLGSVYPASDGTVIYFGDYCIGCSLKEGPWLVADYASDGSNVWEIIRNDTYRKTSDIGWELLTYYDGVVYSVIEGKNLMQAFDASTGVILWSAAIGGVGNTIPTAGPNMVLVGYSNLARVTALDSTTGAILWSFDTDSPVSATPACCVLGNFFVGTSAGTLYCITPEGVKLWSTTLDASVAATPAIAFGKVFVSTKAGTTYAFGALTGEEFWSTSIEGSFDSAPVISTNGILYEVTASGTVYALDIDNGGTLWSYDLGESITTCPALYNRTLYVADKCGVIYAFNDNKSTP